MSQRIERSKKYLVHDEKNRMYSCLCPYILLKHMDAELRKDDVVIIRNCPPVSALKRFKLENILKSPSTEREIARARKAQDVTEALSVQRS